ncbi:MAG: branched-chain amino acid ABC transporter permease [Alphaproteobacteria bacterium]
MAKFDDSHARLRLWSDGRADAGEDAAMPFMMIDFWQALAAGILVGSAYALMCVGLNIIFGAMRVINFAQGDFLMLGMYAAFYLTTGYGVLLFLGPYAGPIVAAFIAGPIVFAIGWFIHRFIVSRVTGAGVANIEGAGHYGQILVTLGLSLILTNGGLILFGSTPLGIRTPLSRQSWEIGEVLLNQARTVSCIVAIAVAAGVYLFLNHTRIGKALRAAADNPQAAIYMGIDVDRAHRVAWSLGVGITAIAGGLVATFQTFQPYIGFEFVIVMYAGVVLGGLGSIVGAFWGGLLIGIVQQMSTLVLPYQLQNTAIFVVFLLIIFLRPQGMFGRLTERT